MIASILMGIAAGARSMTPLAAVAWLARRGELPSHDSLERLLARAPVAVGTALLALGEIIGDKLGSAPDRVVAPGMAGRIVTGAVAGAALAERRHCPIAALLGAVTAIVSAHLTFELRRRATGRFGERPSGAAEDVAVVACALLAAGLARRSGGERF